MTDMFTTNINLLTNISMRETMFIVSITDASSIDSPWIYLVYRQFDKVNKFVDVSIEMSYIYENSQYHLNHLY